MERAQEYKHADRDPLALLLFAARAEAQFSAGLYAGYGVGFGVDTPYGLFVGLRAGYLRMDGIYIGFANDNTYIRRSRGLGLDVAPMTLAFLAELGKEWRYRKATRLSGDEAVAPGDIGVRPYVQLGAAVQPATVSCAGDGVELDFSCPDPDVDVGMMVNPGAAFSFHHGPHFAWVLDLRISTLWFLDKRNWNFTSTDGVAFSLGFRYTPFAGGPAEEEPESTPDESGDLASFGAPARALL